MTVRVFAPAAVIDGQTSGTVRPVDEHSCLLTLRGDSFHLIATVIGMVDADFEVVEPPEFAAAVRALGDRYHRASARTEPASKR